MNVPGPILPPRPNLGPEPWPQPPRLSWPWLLIPLLAAILVLGLLLARRRRPATTPPPAPASPMPSDPGPPADPVREALARAFGPSWRALTTEEIAASVDLPGRFGDEVAAQVVPYLRAVDRSKFSADPAPPDEDLAWWAARFVEEVEAGRGGE